MAITPILASESTTIVPEQLPTFDRWHIVRLAVESPDPNVGARLEVRFRKGHKHPDTGVWTLAPRSDETVKELRVENLLALASENQSVETVMNGVIAAVTAIASDQGLL